MTGLYIYLYITLSYINVQTLHNPTRKNKDTLFIKGYKIRR